MTGAHRARHRLLLGSPLFSSSLPQGLLLTRSGGFFFAHLPNLPSTACRHCSRSESRFQARNCRLPLREAGRSSAKQMARDRPDALSLCDSADLAAVRRGRGTLRRRPHRPRLKRRSASRTTAVPRFPRRGRPTGCGRTEPRDCSECGPPGRQARATAVWRSAANRSRGGESFVTLPATTKDGTLSHITPMAHMS
jgi:hypothetical protein